MGNGEGKGDGIVVGSGVGAIVGAVGSAVGKRVGGAVPVLDDCTGADVGLGVGKYEGCCLVAVSVKLRKISKPLNLQPVDGKP